MKILGQVDNLTAFGTNFGTVSVAQVDGKYQDGSPVVDIYCYDRGYEEKFGRLTVYVSSAQLKPDEFLVKTWSENEWAFQLLDAGIFKDTGGRVHTGYTEAQIWKLKQSS